MPSIEMLEVPFKYTPNDLIAGNKCVHPGLWLLVPDSSTCPRKSRIISNGIPAVCKRLSVVLHVQCGFLTFSPILWIIIFP